MTAAFEPSPRTGEGRVRGRKDTVRRGSLTPPKPPTVGLRSHFCHRIEEAVTQPPTWVGISETDALTWIGISETDAFTWVRISETDALTWVRISETDALTWVGISETDTVLLPPPSIVREITV